LNLKECYDLNYAPQSHAPVLTLESTDETLIANG
jgi:hypothetical protein